MDGLCVGDGVRVVQHTLSDVLSFAHKLERDTAIFVVFQKSSRHKVSMTPGHYVYVNGASFVPAASVHIGDGLTLASGARSMIFSLSEAVYAGVYDPQTLHSDVVVDGIAASSYKTVASLVLGQASLSPLRALLPCAWLPARTANGGADYVARLLPSGVH